MKLSNKLRTFGTALGIGALALLGSGCKDNQNANESFSKGQAYLSQRESAVRNADSDDREKVQRDINQITGCQLFNGRRIHYDEFIETTGLARTLGKEYNDFTVHVDVVSDGKLRDLDKDWRLQPSIQDPHTNEARYVNVYVNADGGWSMLGKLKQKQNDYLGIKPLPSDVVGGYP